MRNLTEEEKETLQEFLADKELTKENVGNHNDYYGVYQGINYGEEKQKLDKKLEPLMTIIKAKIPKTVSFCSFYVNKEGKDGIRTMSNYGNGFTGVAYESVEYLMTDHEIDEPSPYAIG